MPEGPEAFSIAKNLNDHLVGSRILFPKVLYEPNRSIGDSCLKKIMEESPLTVEKVWSRGKRVVLQLLNTNKQRKFLFSTLAMTGHWIIEREKKLPAAPLTKGEPEEDSLWKTKSPTKNRPQRECTKKSNTSPTKDAILDVTELPVPKEGILDTFPFNSLDRVAFECESPKVDDGKPKDIFVLIFRDQRKFGKLEYLDKEKLDSKLSALGPDVLNDKFTKESFKKIFRTGITPKRSKTLEIGSALLNQEIICGIGNYMRADILYKAGLSPYRTIDDLNDDELENLRKACKEIGTQSAKDGGHTIANYFLPDGSPGTYQALVYGKTKTTSGDIVQKDSHQGRSIYWSPSKQK